MLAGLQMWASEPNLESNIFRAGGAPCVLLLLLSEPRPSARGFPGGPAAGTDGLPGTDPRQVPLLVLVLVLRRRRKGPFQPGAASVKPALRCGAAVAAGSGLGAGAAPPPCLPARF